MPATERVGHVPTAIILPFVVIFGVWILAEHRGLSAVPTMASYAIALECTAPGRLPARTCMPTNVVWRSAVLTLNILAFIFIGPQVRPILESENASVHYKPPRPMPRPTPGSGLVISWAGMRGIVTLAAAMALPANFSYRNLILSSAWC